MNTPDLLVTIGTPRADHAALAARISDRPEQISEVLDGLDATPARVRFGCLKVLRRLAEQHPAALYPRFDRIAKRLESGNSILRWGTILMLGDLASVDSEGKLDLVLARYLRPIRGPDLITAANTIVGAGKILRSKPALFRPILRALLRVETTNYRTSECRNVALGHVLQALDLGLGPRPAPPRVLAFARRQRVNRRPAVRRKARAFLARQRISRAAAPSRARAPSRERPRPGRVSPPPRTPRRS